MAVEAYSGIPGLAINVTTPHELYEALDALHTQVLDNFDEASSAPFVQLLETAMDRAYDLCPDPPKAKWL